MSVIRKRGIFVRRLTESDLGLFAARRPAIRSRQRAININSGIADQIMPRDARRAGSAAIASRRWGSEITEERTLTRQDKNWRLGGAKIEGEEFATLEPGDWFVARYELDQDRKIFLTWRVVQFAREAYEATRLATVNDPRLIASMVHLPEGDPDFDLVEGIAFAAAVEEQEAIPEPVAAPPPPPPRRARPERRAPSMPRPVRVEPPTPTTVQEHARNPHIAAELTRVANDIIGSSQIDFIRLVVDVAGELRTVLQRGGLIRQIAFDHKAFWPSVAGRRIAAVDGGMASIDAIGSAPLAVRVGAYVVTPGDNSAERESFTIERQLVDELFVAPPAAGGVFRRAFPDAGALRDAARISIESAAAVRLVTRRDDLDVVLTHGALINPVSRYSDLLTPGEPPVPWPEFGPRALAELLPPEDPARTGRDAQFIPVHLRQLQILGASKALVCGVVERPGASLSVTRKLIASLDDHLIQPLLPMPAAQWRARFDIIEQHYPMVTDSLLLRLALFPHETTVPVPISRNELRRAPPAWSSVVAQYPEPHVAFFLSSDRSAPVRYELFEKDVPRLDQIAALLLHSSKLLPGYAFPVGLDIVDKFAKVPAWLSRPVAARAAAGLLQRAIATGDDRVVSAVRSLLTAGKREWYLRPKA